MIYYGNTVFKININFHLTKTKNDFNYMIQHIKKWEDIMFRLASSTYHQEIE